MKNHECRLALQSPLEVKKDSTRNKGVLLVAYSHYTSVKAKTPPSSSPKEKHGSWDVEGRSPCDYQFEGVLFKPQSRMAGLVIPKSPELFVHKGSCEGCSLDS